MPSNHLLRRAAQDGDPVKVRARLAAGDDLELRNKGTGRTPLLEAVIAGHPHVVTLLLDEGAALEVSCTAVGHTVLGWAVVQQHHEIVRLLLSRGAHVDAVAANSFLGRTPLHLAAQTGDVAITAMLMDAGADIDAVDRRSENALSLARAGSHADAVALLETAGASEPAPSDSFNSMAWPDLDWDPTQLAHTTELPEGAEPAQIVASYIRALYAWELAAWQQHNEAERRGDYFDLGPGLAEAEHLTGLHTTDKLRRYRRASIGAIPDLTPDFVLVDITESSRSRHELSVRHPNPSEFVHDYEWTFVCLRRNGLWRIDSARSRLRGSTTWESAIL